MVVKQAGTQTQAMSVPAHVSLLQVLHIIVFCLQVTITDNDLIEKSNLNRQFLFRPHHIQVGPLVRTPLLIIICCVMQKPKSVIAAKSTLDINPGN